MISEGVDELVCIRYEVELLALRAVTTTNHNSSAGMKAWPDMADFPPTGVQSDDHKNRIISKGLGLDLFSNNCVSLIGRESKRPLSEACKFLAGNVSIQSVQKKIGSLIMIRVLSQKVLFQLCLYVTCTFDEETVIGFTIPTIA